VVSDKLGGVRVTLVNFIHPKDYSYFNTLSSKLGWSKKLF
jgi:NAD kinase